MRTLLTSVGELALRAVVFGYHAGFLSLVSAWWILALLASKYPTSEVASQNLAEPLVYFTFVGGGVYYCLLLYLLVMGRKRANWSNRRQLAVVFLALIPGFGAFYYTKQVRVVSAMTAGPKAELVERSKWRRIEHIVAIVILAIMIVWAYIWVYHPEMVTAMQNTLTGPKQQPRWQPLEKPELSIEEVLRRMRSEDECEDPNLKWMLAWYIEDPNTDVWTYVRGANDVNEVPAGGGQ